MVATIDAVLTRPDRDIERACRGRAPLHASSSARCGSFPGRRWRSTGTAGLVLDLVGGYADTQRGELVRPGHALPALLGHQAVRRRRALAADRAGTRGLDEPVAAIWPAFAQQGKDRVLVRHILSHRGGFPTTPPDLPRERWGDWEAAIRAVAAMPLEHEPGTVSAYHMLTQHWVFAELVRRLDGRAYADYLREEITGPLGLADTYVGLQLISSIGSPSSTPRTGRTTWASNILRAMHDLPLHRMVVPGASGVSTARDMARFYAAIAAGGALDGARILRPETVERMLRVEVDGEIDRTFDVPVRRGLGLRAGRAGRSAPALARRDEHRAHLLARRVRLLRLLGRPRLWTGDGLPDQRRAPRRSRRHRPPRSLRRGPGRVWLARPRV